MPAKRSASGTRGWVLFAAVVAVSASVLAVVAFWPAPAPPACPNCQGRALSDLLSLGSGMDRGSSSAHVYCFPVQGARGGLSIQQLDVGIRLPNGSWLPPDDNLSLGAIAPNGTTMATFYFADFHGVEGPLWFGNVGASVVAGYSFCLASGPVDLRGLTFVLAGVGFDPQGQVSQPIP